MRWGSKVGIYRLKTHVVLAAQLGIAKECDIEQALSVHYYRQELRWVVEGNRSLRSQSLDL